MLAAQRQQPLVGRHGAGEGPLGMPKEFGLQQSLGIL